jgi:pimeloyl-ACP methyl ester carboxylesterase
MRSKCRVSVMLAGAMLAYQGSAVTADDLKSEFFVAKGVKIHYLVAGRGEPVVLIHGLHASANINWKINGVIAELANDRRVVAIDLPGHGRSDKPEGKEAYGIQLVEDVVLLLDHLNIERAHVVGYSMGGMTAMKLAATHPERVRSVLLGGMGWFREGSALQDFWGRREPRENSRVPAAFLEGMPQLALSTDELKSIQQPIKVVIGQDDPVKRMYVTPLLRVRDDIPIVEIPDAGHINCVAKPQFRAEIAGWIRSRSARP